MVFLIQGLTPGVYEVHAYAFSTATGTFNQARIVVLTFQADPRMAVDVPNGPYAQQPFLLGGWAIDLAAASGLGVNTVHVWARNLAGGAEFPLGAASYGVTRPDVGAAFGAQFTQSGYELVVSGLAAGTYRFTVYAYSLVANSFNQAVQFEARILRRRWPDGQARVVKAAPIQGIVAEARRMKADVVVVGWRGHGPLHRLLAGSVSRGVAKRAPCSVLVVRETRRAFRRIAIGIDGSPHSARALEFLTTVTPPRGGRVTLLQAVDMMPVPRQGLAPAALLGSVAEGACHASSVPVLIVR